MPDTPVSPSSALDQIRGLIAERDDLAARMDWSVVAGASLFDAAQDKLAARVPSLVAAIERVLEGHEPMPTYGPALNPDGSSACGHDPDDGRHFETSLGEWVCQGDPGPLVCARCSDTLLDDGEAVWPCAVYAAVTAALTGEEATP